MQFLANATGLRAALLFVIGLIGVLFPGLIPEGAQETIADHAVQAIGAVMGVWALFAAHRAKRQSEGAEGGAKPPRGL